MEFVGEVEAVGSAVTEFEVGDAVFGVKGFGANAELVCVPETGALAHKRPGSASKRRRRSATAPASLWRACERRISARDSASSSTAPPDRSAPRRCSWPSTRGRGDGSLSHAERRAGALLGADEVVDYLQEDFSENGETYDVVLDAVGKHSFRRCRGSLKPGGRYLETDLGFLWHVPLLALLTRWLGDKKVSLPIPTYTKEEVLLLKGAIEAGRYRAVIDRSYPLADVVEATRYVETGQKTGNVVLTVG